MLTRRKFLRLSTLTGLGFVLPSIPLLGCGDQQEEQTQTLTAQTSLVTRTQKVYKPPSQIDKFIDPLPVLPTLPADTERFASSDYYEIVLGQFSQETHSQLPPTTVWGYQEVSPGPVIEARKDRPARIKWNNSGMPSRHLLEASIDRTLFPAGVDMPDVRTVSHLHGGHTPPQFDGLPEAWSTPSGTVTGRGFTPEDFIYPNQQQACCLWFHDHSLAITRLNVYAGLSGLYIIRDEEEESLGLPSGIHEIPLIIQDKTFNNDGSLFYPTQGAVPEYPVWNPFFFGETPLVNGKAFPFLDAEPRRYRLRLLNASQSRVFSLWFEQTNGGSYPFHVIGSDGGLLAAPFPLQRITLAPAERADIIIDLKALGMNGSLLMKNDAPTPYPMGGSGTPINELMQIRVKNELSERDNSTPVSELKLPLFSPPAPTPGLPSRQIHLVALQPGAQTVQFQINNKAFLDPVEEMPVNGTTEMWEFVNLTEDAHPMHIHLVQFAILNRQPFDLENYYTARENYRSGNSPPPELSDYVTGPPVPPSAHESGWKDTALALPRQILRLSVPFNLPLLAKAPATYAYHCHILEHEDNDMMRPFEVV